jgi:hypothetical protein
MTLQNLLKTPSANQPPIGKIKEPLRPAALLEEQAVALFAKCCFIGLLPWRDFDPKKTQTFSFA